MDYYGPLDPLSPKNCISRMQNERYEIFKTQDLTKGHFNITFNIGGKMLHSHSFILASVSETMDSWLSGRWTKKDEIVEVDSHSYESFCELLHFLYTGACDLTNENVFGLTEVAEFYGVTVLKELCDKFLSKSKNTSITLENAEEAFEFAQTYSLQSFTDFIKNSLDRQRNEFINAPGFLGFKKSFVQFLAETLSGEEIFKAIYQWAEHEVMTHNNNNRENVLLSEAIKSQMNEVLPNPEYSKMSFDFLMDFVLEKGFIISSSELFKYFRGSSSIYWTDRATLIRFESVCQLAKKQAANKCKFSTENESDSIKADLADTLPHVKFYQVNKEFLMNFVVANGIIDVEQARKISETRVEVKNGEKAITGFFIDDCGFRVAFDCDGSWCSKYINPMKRRYYNVKVPIPSSPSTVTKMKGVNWYLCLEKGGVNTGIATLKHHSLIKRNDYLIAHMVGNDEFDLNSNKNIYLSFSDND